MSEPKVIYLGPACEADTGDGRTWAEDNPWPDCECGHRPVQYVLGETFDRMKAERDALQLSLNAADQRIDELTPPVSPDPVTWGAPKTVRQLIQQLLTLDQDLRPLSMLRVPGNIFEDGKERTRALHLSISHERVDGQWLVPFKSEGEKVLALWCRMENPNPLTEAEERDKLIAYGRSCGLDEAATLCNRMAYDTYYPAGSRFKHFIPKALEQQGNLLIKAANAIASLPDGPYDRFKASQQKKAGTSASA